MRTFLLPPRVPERVEPQRTVVWEQYAFFNLSSPALSSGTHYGTYYAADIDNRLQRYDLTFTTP
jgi:hypothetical protein